MKAVFNVLEMVMSKLKPGHVYVEVVHNIVGGFSLCICDDSGGNRISGAKIGGCETFKRFEVDADELIREIRSYRARKPRESS